jgi:phage repressor protein C with HTH and peptisase S24 domain
MESLISSIGGLEPAARASEASVLQLTSWKFGRSRPDFFALRRLCDAANVSIEWLATGEGGGFAGPNSRSSSGQMMKGGSMLQVMDADRLADRSMVLLPRLDVEAAAGAGVIVGSEDVAEMLAFSADWLRDRQISPRAARILTARGDSMEPTIRDGDLLIVDTAIEIAVDNGIYVIAYGGVLLVKRLFVLRNGGLVIASDNKVAGRDEEIPPHEVPEVHIAGRVMWYGRTI